MNHGYRPAPHLRPAQHAAPAPPGRPIPNWGAPAVGAILRPGGVLGAFEVIVGLVAFLAMLGAVGIVQSSTNISLLVPTVLALIPLLVVLRVVNWVDRWEPEPRSLLVVTFAWGAGVAILVSLFLNTAVAISVAESTGSRTEGEFVSAVISAPIVEEAAKGFILLLLLWLRRGAIGGPVDGVVYACTTAAGFAFMENIAYFVRYSDQLGEVFVLRALLSPFIHLVFTSMTGIAIGYAAAHRSRSAWVRIAPVGYVLAVSLHAAWNYSATISTGMLLITQIPILLILVSLIHWLQNREMEVVAQQLQTYVRAGWVAPWEVALTTSAPHRRAASAWARLHGKRVTQELGEFRANLINLALLSRTANNGQIPANFRDLESKYLATLAAKRESLAAVRQR